MSTRTKFANKGEFLAGILCREPVMLPETYETTLSGDVLYIPLDEDRRVKVSLGNDPGFIATQGQWHGLTVEVISKTSGRIDRNYINFQAVSISIDQSHQNAHAQRSMHVWSDRGEVDWYILRPADDNAGIVDSVAEYVETWR